jgi:UDP-N-acetylglucosamine pyrophosphorylase
MCAEDSVTMNVEALQSFETSVTAHPTKVSQLRKHEYLTLPISKVVSIMWEDESE